MVMESNSMFGRLEPGRYSKLEEIGKRKALATVPAHRNGFHLNEPLQEVVVAND
jgi:hypothetical protein